MTRVLIAGAGLGGLAAAIALARRGFAVEVFEQATELREVGAGLTVSRSAQRVLGDLGVLDRTLAAASLTPCMAFLHYRDGRLLAGGFDHGDGRGASDAATGGIHIHRADMQAILVARFAELAPGRLHLGRAVAGFEDLGDAVLIRLADGGQAEGDLLVGADGVRSAVRAALWETPPPRFTGQVAYRFTMPGDLARPFLAAGRAALFQGPGRVFNRYTLRAGALLNCVGIARSDAWTGDGWSTPARVGEMLALYEGWHPDVTGLMAAAPTRHLIKWALFDRPPLPRWGRGRVTLLGDAAHPMLPFLGLGAAMAFEDGLVLARALMESPDVAGLRRYEQHRRPRADLIAELSRVQGEASQSRDPDAYDPSTAPAQNSSIQAYDPVTAPLTP
jgi:salicylate hydroxylase